MTATETVPVSDTSILEALDFHEARTCEHSRHGTVKTHADGDEQFIHLNYTCPDCAETVNEVRVYCGAWLTFAFKTGLVRCPVCSCGFVTAEVIAILGPANEGRKS